MSIVSNSANPAVNDVLNDCAVVLRRVADYQLPPAIDQRMLWLSEHKDVLSVGERDELLALIDFTDSRTVEKLQAQAALSKLSEVVSTLAAKL